MATQSGATLWFSQALFASLGLFAVLAAMLPLGLSANAIPMPDLVFILAVAWVIRRPVAAPLGLVAAIAIIADILLMRPIGLWALVMIFSVEAVRARRWTIREHMFLVEWAIFATLFAVSLVATSIILGLAFAPRPGAYIMFTYFLSTVIAYPIVVGLLQWVLGVKRPKVAHRTIGPGQVS